MTDYSMSRWVRSELFVIRSALDDALGDTDVTYMSDDELRDQEPAQWACMKLSELLEWADNE